MKKILLDTGAYGDYLRGNENTLDILSRSSVVYMSVFVLGELYSGFKAGSKETLNREMLRVFLEKPTVAIIDATVETSEIFAEVKNSLRVIGNPIPINDVWISAHAIETGSALVSNDNHFKKIPGLRLLNY